jgi:hypothetical protein
MPKLDWINDGPSPLGLLIRRDKVKKEMHKILLEIEHTDYEHHGKMMDRYEELRKELYDLNRWD